MKNLRHFAKNCILLLLLLNVGCIITIHAQEWEEMAPMAVARGGAQSCIMDSMIYVFGGAGATTSYITINSAEVYNIETNQWSELATIPVNV
jgi:N-acetylneuraminic acid mutarotase